MIAWLIVAGVWLCVAIVLMPALVDMIKGIRR